MLALEDRVMDQRGRRGTVAFLGKSGRVYVTWDDGDWSWHGPDELRLV